LNVNKVIKVNLVEIVANLYICEGMRFDYLIANPSVQIFLCEHVKSKHFIVVNLQIYKICASEHCLKQFISIFRVIAINEI